MLQKICNDVEPGRYLVLREIVDNPSLWDGNTLIGAATEVAIERSLNLSITGFLKWADWLHTCASLTEDCTCYSASWYSDCDSNRSLWEALQADSLLDEELNDLLSSVTEVSSEVGE